MKKIWFSSHNPNKLQEIKSILEPLNFEVHSPAELPDFPEVEETGTTLTENAILKAQALFDIVKEPVIADDTGLLVDALNGEPGVYSARFAGVNGTDADCRSKLLTLLTDITERQAHFECVIAYIDKHAKIHTFTGIATGQITTAEVIGHGFGYDAVFYSDELAKTFSAATEVEKNRVSHRGKALHKFITYLKEEKN